MRLDIIDKTVIIEIPDSFKEIGEKEISQIYSGGLIINKAFCDQDAKAHIGIAVNGYFLNNDNLEERLSFYQNLYSRMTPGFFMGQMGINRDTDPYKAIMSFKSNTIERDLLNVLAITPYMEKELIVLCNCSMNDSPQLFRKFIKMIESISVLNGEIK